MRARSTRLLLPAVLGAAVAVWAIDGALVNAQSPAPTPTDERVLGIWQLNVAKSKFTPGPPYRDQTRTYARQADGVKATLKTTYADGHSATVEYVVNYDSLEYPVTGSPDYDAIKLKKIDALTSEAVLGHGGTVFATARRVISEDGKTMTITFHANELQGFRFHNVMVYDRRK
jgi:hypothetical protein